MISPQMVGLGLPQDALPAVDSVQESSPSLPIFVTVMDQALGEKKAVSSAAGQPNEGIPQGAAPEPAQASPLNMSGSPLAAAIPAQTELLEEGLEAGEAGARTGELLPRPRKPGSEKSGQVLDNSLALSSSCVLFYQPPLELQFNGASQDQGSGETGCRCPVQSAAPCQAGSQALNRSTGPGARVGDGSSVQGSTPSAPLGDEPSPPLAGLFERPSIQGSGLTVDPSLPALEEEKVVPPRQIMPMEKDASRPGILLTKRTGLSDQGSKDNPLSVVDSVNNSAERSSVELDQAGWLRSDGAIELLPPIREDRGITDAPSQETMKSVAKMTRGTQGDEKSLPRISPGVASLPPASELAARALDVSAALGTRGAQPSTLDAVVASLSDTVPVSPATPVAAKIETLSEIVLRHTVELKHLGARALEVVLRTDPQTELRLQLTQDQGGIHVAAHCEKGDWETLSRQWADLQQSLGAQGIQVGQLEPPRQALTPSDTAGFGASRHSHQQSPSGQEHRHFASREEPAFAQAAPAPSRPGPATSTPVRPDWLKRWESWA